MRIRLLATLSILLLSSTAMAEGVRAKFIGNGIYATVEGCAKLAAIEAGGPQNLETTPETLTKDGFKSWESSCHFVSIKTRKKGKKWIAKMACAAEVETSKETDIFIRNSDGSFDVLVEGDQNITHFVRCDGAGK